VERTKGVALFYLARCWYFCGERVTAADIARAHAITTLGKYPRITNARAAMERVRDCARLTHLYAALAALDHITAKS